MGQFSRLILFPTAEQEIPAPLKRDFSPELWTLSWKRFREDEVDDRLHKSGLWIYERWRCLHGHRIHLEGIISPHNPRNLLLKWVNEQAIRLFESAKSSILNEIDLTAGMLSRAQSENPVAVDSLLILIGDTVAKFVDTYPAVEEQGEYSPYIDQYIYELGFVFISLLQIEHRWEDCLKLGFWVEEVDGGSRFYDPDPKYSKSCALASDRRSNNELELALGFIYAWNNSRYTLGRQIPVIARAKIDCGNLACDLVAGYADYPESALHRYVAEKSTMEPILSLSLPKFGGTRVTDLLDAYQVLASLGTIIRIGELQIMDPKARVTSARVPLVKTNDLITLLKESLGWEQRHAEEVIAVFIYKKGARDGGWSMPLLPVGHEFVNICLPLLATNPARLIEHWLIRGGVSNNAKGRLYEKEIRGRLRQSINNNPILNGIAYVCQHSVDIETRLGVRDIDLLLRIGQTIFVGEIKAIAQPLMPWERRNYIETIFSEAPEQLTLRMEGIYASTDTQRLLASKTQYPGNVEDLRFVCVIISTHPEGSGCSINDIPIIDWDSLQEYFSSNVYEMGWVTKEGYSFVNPEVTMILYSDAKQCEKRLKTYLQMSPRSAARKLLLSSQPVRGDDPVRRSGKFVEYEQWFVRPYDAPELLASARSMVEEWEIACARQNV